MANNGPIVEIDGLGRVQLGPEFLSLSPEQQHATIQEIASHPAWRAKSGSDLPDGFQLDQPSAAGLPPGYVLDQPTNNLGTAGALLTEGFKGIPIGGAYYPQVASAASKIGSALGLSNEVSPEDVKTSVAAYEQQHPYISTAAQIGGGVAALAPLGATSLGARMLGLNGGAIRGALSGAGLGAADSAARGENPATGAALGGAFGAAAPMISRGIGAVLPKASSGATVDAVRGDAKSFYDSVERSAAPMPAGAAQAVKDAISVDAELAPATHKIVDRLASLANPTEGDFFATQKKLGDVFTGAPDREWKAAGQARDAISALIPGLKEADQNYASAALADILQAKGASSELRALASNSGLNYSNTLKQKLTSWLDGPGKRAPGEIQASVQDLISGNVASNSLRWLANYLGGGGGLGHLLATGAGAMVGGMPGAIAAPAAGLGLRMALNRQTGNQLRSVVQQALDRSPYAQALPVPTPSVTVPTISRSLSLLSRSVQPTIDESLSPVHR